MAFNILVTTGEASGDERAAPVIQALKQRFPDAEIAGSGGPALRALHFFNCLIPIEAISVLGLVEVFSRYKVLKKALSTIKNYIQSSKPRLVILVDFSGFNLRVAKWAKEEGAKVLYFVSPQVWAWPRGRIPLIQQYVDHMAVILPFEEAFYKKHNIPVTYVGNPLVNEIKAVPSKLSYDFFKLNPDLKTVALLPGSRTGEIRRLLPIFLKAAEQLNQFIPKLQFVLPVASTISSAILGPYLKQSSLKIHLIYEEHYALYKLCDAAICASGTVSLELALLQVPHLVAYKVSMLTYWIAKCFVNVDYIALCNLVAQRPIVKEYIQQDANVSKLTQELRGLLSEERYIHSMKGAMKGLEAVFGQHDVSREVVEIASSLLAI